MTATTGAIAEINLSALCDNYRLLCAQGKAVSAAVVKADAYGLGAKDIAKALYKAGCRHFFTASIAEAVALRHALKDATIGVFYGVASDEDVKAAIAHDLIPCLNERGQIARWQDAAKSHERGLPAILHFDTGMSRLGLSHAEAVTLSNDATLLEGIIPHMLMSHLACADTHEHPLNKQQRERFAAICELFPDVHASLANSSGVFLGEDYHFDMIRPGAALYGINPHAEAENPMHTVVTLRSPVLQVRELTQSETVGYGATYNAPKGSRLAAVAGGYADGLIRAMGNEAQAWVNGHKVAIAGIVSMDVTVLDISALPQNAVQVGDWVEFVGAHMPVDTIAAKAGTIGYELFTSIGSRVQRKYIR